MIIAISGLHGTGKTTVSEIIAKKYGLKFYSTGMMFRELAKEKGLTLEQLSKLAEKDLNIDIELDNKIKNYAAQGNCVIDSQLAAFLLADIVDISILLKCDKEIRIARMMKRDSENISEKIKETEMREESEHKRFKELYEIDIQDGRHILETFDFILDTSHLDIEGISRILTNIIDENIRISHLK